MTDLYIALVNRYTIKCHIYQRTESQPILWLLNFKCPTSGLPRKASIKELYILKMIAHLMYMHSTTQKSTEQLTQIFGGKKSLANLVVDSCVIHRSKLLLSKWTFTLIHQNLPIIQYICVRCSIYT